MTEECSVPAPRPYPVFWLIAGKPCLVVGGGKIACRKIRDLVECGATVTVVAEDALPEAEELAERGAIRLFNRRFEPDDVDGMTLVIAATDDDAVNAGIAQYARREGIPVNAVDDIGSSDFISGAVVRRGPLRIAVSTSGCSPLISGSIRRELEERYDESFGAYIELAGELRTFILSAECGRTVKDDALRWIAGRTAYDLFVRSGEEPVWKHVKTILFSS